LQADPLLAGLNWQFAEQDARIGQQVVQDDRAGLAPAVGGGYVGLVDLGVGVPKQPVPD
jgi:hypothetical protein